MTLKDLRHINPANPTTNMIVEEGSGTKIAVNVRLSRFALADWLLPND